MTYRDYCACSCVSFFSLLSEGESESESLSESSHRRNHVSLPYWSKVKNHNHSVGF